MHHDDLEVLLMLQSLVDQTSLPPIFNGVKSSYAQQEQKKKNLNQSFLILLKGSSFFQYCYFSNQSSKIFL